MNIQVDPSAGSHAGVTYQRQTEFLFLSRSDSRVPFHLTQTDAAMKSLARQGLLKMQLPGQIPESRHRVLKELLEMKS